MELIAEASNGLEAIEQFRTHRPDVTLMDLQMPEMGGIDALSAIRGEFPEARIIVLTSYAGDVQVSRALRSGARGYLLKDMLRKELLETIRAVHAGQKRLSSEAAAEIAEHATDDALTPRETDVLRLIAAGNANKEIAAQLGLTEETVKKPRQEYSSQTGRKRPDSCGHDRTEARNYRCYSRHIPRKRDGRDRFLGCRSVVQIPYHKVGMSLCNVYFRPFLTAGPGSASCCCGLASGSR